MAKDIRPPVAMSLQGGGRAQFLPIAGWGRDRASFRMGTRKAARRRPLSLGALLAQQVRNT